MTQSGSPPSFSLASYDETPYIDLPFAQSHPGRLAVMARLFGMHPPDVATARVLELGCAGGGNLIPMAVAMPDATFLGIDLSARQIADGQHVIAALGLENIELHHADIAGVDADYGSFDYIVSHGIYSWVPAPIREKLLSICRDNLAPNGVAYVSYNARPGWAIRGILRDAMLYHARGAASAAERIRRSREALDFLSQHLPADTAYAAVLRQDLDGLAQVNDAYLSHDHLEDNNEAFYFHEFVDAAERHRLQYLAEADFSAMAPQIPRELKDTLRQVAPDLVAREQYLDFLHHRSFRQTLLVHDEATLERNLTPQSMQAFDIASTMQPESPSPVLAQGVNESFRSASGSTISTASAISKAALVELGRAWPRALSFATLTERARKRLRDAAAAGAVSLEDDTRTLGIDMLQCYAAGATELRLWSPALSVEPSPQPVASVLARLQATRGAEVTNLLHKGVTLNPFGRALVPLLDGTRNRPLLIAALKAAMTAGTLALPSQERALQRTLLETLSGLGKAALLTG